MASRVQPRCDPFLRRVRRPVLCRLPCRWSFYARGALADHSQQLVGGALAGGDGPVEESLSLDGGVLAGEVNRALAAPGEAPEARGLADPAVGVGALHPWIERPVV